MDRLQPDIKAESEPSVPFYDALVTEAIKAAKQAQELKDAAIKRLLFLREQIDAGLNTLGYEPIQEFGRMGRNGTPHPTVSHESELKRPPGPKPFSDMDLASVARIILREHNGGPMHGKEIERIAKAGGYAKGGAHWQGYLGIALKRAGGFENIGMNRWKLNDQVAPVPIGRKVL